MNTLDLFTTRAAHYHNNRPNYPIQLLELLQRQYCLKSNHVVADIGSGTGLLGQLFLDNGNPTYCVEPNDLMRLEAEKNLKRYSNFYCIARTAESTGLSDKSVDYIFAAQAFHWFKREDFLLECRRIAKANCYLGLIWNKPCAIKSEIMKQFQSLIDSYRISQPINLHQCDDDSLKNFFKSKEPSFFSFDNIQCVDREGFIGRLLSVSHMPTKGDQRYNDFIKDAEQIFNKHQNENKIRLEYRTQLYLIPVSDIK